MSSIPPHDAGAPRRRTVLTTVTRRPFALIAQNPQVLRAIMLDYGPCVPFPSITHFRNASEERWAGVVIARASAWDPVLEFVARRHTPIALIDVVLEHEWPDEVERLEGEAALRTWLEACVAPKPAKNAVRPSSRKVLAPPAPQHGEVSIDTLPSPLALRDTRKYARPGSQLLIVAKDPSLRARLFHVLRVARPVHVVADVSELRDSELKPEAWLGVVIADGAADATLVAKLLRNPCVMLQIDPTEELDELALKRWLLRAVAYEYSGHAAVSEFIADAFIRADPASYVASIEVCALYACSLRPDQRASALDMTDHTWRWYAKESAKALTISSKALANSALERLGREQPLPPSRWLPSEPSEAPPRFETLSRRLPGELRAVPLSRVPWPESKALEVTRVALEHGVHTVEELLSLDLSALDVAWGHERTCDSLQEALLSTLPFEGGPLPHEVASFNAVLTALSRAMPNEAEALSLTQTQAPGRPQRGLSRALRFHEPLLDALRLRLIRALEEPATLAELQERDAFFVDVTSLLSLRDSAQTLLRLPLYLSESEPTRIGTKPVRQARSEIPRALSPSLPAPAPAPRPPSAEESLGLAEQALREAGAPLDRSALTLRLGDAAQSTFYRMAGKRPFVELDARTWGLIERDVPGGNESFDAAATFLRDTFGSQLNTGDAIISAVCSLSEEHGRWTREMAVAAIRYARNLRS